MISYEIIRSRRRTLALQVTREGKVVVRAPLQYPAGRIETFVRQHEDWLQRKITEQKEHKSALPLPTPEEEYAYREQARRVLTEKTAYYAKRMGVTYGRISIRGQKTRWGSCSAKGNLNYNWKLMLCPEEVQDYVVVHELAHRREMNHSKAFYRIVEEILPDYRERMRWLKDHA
ncbi:MAG: M48 family metallopeptidase [Lachnospiraceae bacterium]|nr:M48 family metallopeptidase [Lachnospiraceae bacterium]